jgi:hypothetical protein
MNLTLEVIKKQISGNPKIGQIVKLKQDKVAVWTNEGFTWENDCRVEIFRIGDYERHTLKFLKTCIKNITKETK